jgi:hypothetical protein
MRDLLLGADSLALSDPAEADFNARLGDRLILVT